MKLRALLPAFRQHLAAHDAAPRTIASYTRTVEAFLASADGGGTSRAEVEAFLGRESTRGGRLASTTKRGELMGLRAFFRYASREAGASDPTDGITIPRERRAAPRFAAPAQVPKLFRAAAESDEPARNLALLGLFFVLGLRVHEVAQLRVEQIDLDTHMLWRVRGKGGSVVDLPVPPKLEVLLAGWLRVRTMRGHAATGPLFPTARPSTSRTGHLSIRSLQRLVNRLSQAAGLATVLGPHALRHGHGTASIAVDNDVPTTSSMMRHASIATTQIYVHLSGDAQRTGYERVSGLIPPEVLPSDATPNPDLRPDNHVESRMPPKLNDSGTSRGAQGAVDIHPP